MSFCALYFQCISLFCLLSVNSICRPILLLFPRSQGNHHIKAFTVSADGTSVTDDESGGRVFVDMQPGLADGFRCDEQGNVWTSAGDGVHCYSAEGKVRCRLPRFVSLFYPPPTHFYLARSHTKHYNCIAFHAHSPIRISLLLLQLLGKILLPHKTSNCVFGGPRGDRLFITASTDVFAVQLRVRGANAFA